MAIDEEFSAEKAFDFAYKVIYDKTGNELNDIEKELFVKAWDGYIYSQMAGENRTHGEETFKKYGSKLWKKLSEALDKQVSKTNFKTLLELHYKDYKGKVLIQNSKPSSPNENYDLASNNQTQPIAQLEYPDGQVPLSSLFYVERGNDEKNCYKEILQPGALIRIKGSKQTGKTSLITRIIDYAEQKKYKTLYINIENTNSQFFQSINKFLHWFCAIVSKKLSIVQQLDSWDKDEEIYGSNICCTNYFEEYLLREIDMPIVIALDEIHKIYQYPEVYKEFLVLLRSWYDEAKNSDIFKNLRIIVAYSTEGHIKLNNHQSPFNVGHQVSLPDFDTIQIKSLMELHGLELSDTQIQKIETILGGHPYLIRLAFYHITDKNISIDCFLKEAATESGIYSDHLRSHLQNLQEDVKLYSAFMKVISSDIPVQLEPQEVYQLKKLGLVLVNGDEVTPRCDLYRRYFHRFI